ncbi:hypothetical protein N7G274_004529 [Stereocaulon virgatum]|uniref:DUF1690-domain-containing protein n=1 Tax=Stereocaulon virgatum TaxID=373712 RepID=A0ABR4AAH6_9LECA
MGSGTSKPAPSSTQHVFASETPVRFSQELVDALQASPETDSTRATDLELHIQNRVNAELRRLDEETTKSLKNLEASLSASPDTTTDNKYPSPRSHMPDQVQSKGGADHKAKADGDKIRDLSRESVRKEIEALKAKLKQRQLKEDVVKDEGVNKAREEVVSCLKTNDRRPLDCWREVEAFRREVGRLEGAFLGRVLE